MVTEFFTTETVLTFAGCALATGVLTEMIKKLGILLIIPTQAISYIIALLILVGGNLAMGTFTFAGFFLMLINAAVIALATNGGYDAAKAIARKGEENEQRLLNEELAEADAAGEIPEIDV